MDYLIICGTNRKNSKSKKISQFYQGLLEKKGIASQLIDLAGLPDDYIASALYENAGKNASFQPFRDQMKVARKMVFVVAEYNGSFPGVLKAFIDGMEYPGTFKNKKAALIGLSSGVQGGGLALSHLTDILNYCGTHVLAQKPKLSHIEKNFVKGQFTNPFYVQLLEEQIDEFIDF
ncbi:MAG: NAD(P)H-dependent oxidoreductase [Cyclobacteriaceae bacterium]|nr:NAD(P)H-dependent oxidoreductase [Cyclobacteriaceae bacterium]